MNWFKGAKYGDPGWWGRNMAGGIMYGCGCELLGFDWKQWIGTFLLIGAINAWRDTDCHRFVED